MEKKSYFCIKVNHINRYYSIILKMIKTVKKYDLKIQNEYKNESDT